MKKEDLTVPAIFAEAIGMILGIVYIGLQIYYGIAYKLRHINLSVTLQELF